MKTSPENEAIITEIRGLLDELGHRPDPAECLERETSTYLLARRDSLAELRGRVGAKRTDAIASGDARTAIRLDIRVSDADLTSARASVASSGVALGERDALARRIAERTAWIRARDRYVDSAAQVRCDSMSDAERQPTAGDVAEARRAVELTGAPESAILARAAEIRLQRLRDQHRAAVLATLPPIPAMPRLPQRAVDPMYLTTSAGKRRGPL